MIASNNYHAEPPTLQVVEEHSGFINTRSRLKPRTLRFRYLAEINLILGIWYLQWRVTHSLNWDALYLAIPLLLAEIYSYVGGLMFTIGLWRPLERQVRSLDQLRPELPPHRYPTVDVFVTCYNEPVEIMEQTVRAALALDYPAEKLIVYVLDDGNAAEIAAMTDRLQAEDTQTPRMQRVIAQKYRELAALTERLQEMQAVSQDGAFFESLIRNLKQPIAKPDQPIPNNRSMVWMTQRLWQISQVLHPQHPSLLALIASDVADLANAIQQKQREIATLQRCRYIARPKPSDRPHHAKAGNINYALFSGQTSGEFVVTLDADHILKPHFLKRVLPYFYTYNLQTGVYDSNRVAFVQTPQDFGNLPQGDPFGHYAHLFYGPIQQGKDGLNSAFYTGTNAILRREALVSVGIRQFSQEFMRDRRRIEEFHLVGAMSTYSITEDMNTAMRLHANGWQSVYHHELMAEGLAPNDLSSTLKQRLRWAQGTIQVLIQENPLTMSGLSVWQRLQYFQTMYSYFSGFATLVFLVCPIVYFFTGISPITATGASFALHFLPMFVINRLTFLVATWGISAREVWRSEQYMIALFPLFMRAVLTVLLRRPLSFQVTPKQAQSGIYLRLVTPQLLIFGLTLLGMFWSCYRFLLGDLPTPWVYGVNCLWSIYNLSLLWAIIRAAVWRQPPTSGALIDFPVR